LCGGPSLILRVIWRGWWTFQSFLCQPHETISLHCTSKKEDAKRIKSRSFFCTPRWSNRAKGPKLNPQKHQISKQYLKRSHLLSDVSSFNQLNLHMEILRRLQHMFVE
jgi:hypothetical protein